MGNSILDKLGLGNVILSKIAQGYTANNFVGSALLPVIPTDFRKQRIPKVNRDQFRMFADERNIGADVKKATISYDSYIDVVLNEQSLQYELDYQMIDETMTMYDLMKQKATDMAQSFLLKSEYITAQLVLDTDTYATDNKTTLTSTYQFTHADAKPLDTISAGQNQVQKMVGSKANVAVIGSDAWLKMKVHPNVVHTFFGTSGWGIVTEQMIATALQLDKLLIGTARYESGTADADTEPTFVDIWGDNIVLAYVPQTAAANRSMNQLAFGYHFQMKNMPRIKTFPKADSGDRIEIIDGMDYGKHVILAANAGYLIKDTNA